MPVTPPPLADVNWRFLQQMRQRFGDDWARIAKLSIIEETASGEKTGGWVGLPRLSHHA